MKKLVVVSEVDNTEIHEKKPAPRKRQPKKSDDPPTMSAFNDPEKLEAPVKKLVLVKRQAKKVLGILSFRT